MVRLSVIAWIAAAGLVALPTAASACRLTAPPSAEERIAIITARQTDAWAASPLVYLAEVVEWDLTQDGPAGSSQENLKLAPLAVLKGEALPATLSLRFNATDRRCGRDFLDMHESYGGAGQRFIVYATTASPASADDIWTQIYGEVRDPEAIRAMARLGWSQPAPRFPYQIGN
jgi:hypothetical protein